MTVKFETAQKLKKQINFNSAERFFFNKTKERFYRKDLPTLAKDFDKLYTPAPGLSELISILPKFIKQGNCVFKFFLSYDEAELAKAFYGTEGLVGEEPLFWAFGTEPEEAAAALILKLIKNGKIKI
ncbi:MAG: hypothetical protein K1X86_15590 [Ignavibacteria bacterium]|nr:hypothetical protein [Ignavibacteria bacterium]